MSLTKKVAYNTTVQIVGKVVTTIISLFIIGILTRSLGVNGFGQYTTAFAYVNFIAVIVDMGFFTVLVREIVFAKYPLEKIVNNIITFRAVIAIVIYLISVIIAQFLPYEPIIKIGIALASLAVFFLSMNSTIIALFQAKFRIDKGVISDVIGRLIILISLLVISHKSTNLTLIITAYIIGNFVNFVINYLFAKKYVAIKPAFDFEFWKMIYKEALPMGILIIIGFIYFKIDMVVLSLMKPSYDVGIYGASYKVLEIVLTLPAMFMGAMFPIITQYISQKDERLNNAVQKSFDFLNLITWPIVIGGIFLSVPIIKIIGGNEFVNASAISWHGYAITPSIVLSILLLALGLSGISLLFGQVVLAMKKQRDLIMPNIIIAIINLSLNIIFIHYWSYLAAAIITVLSEFLSLYFAFKIYRRYIDFLPKMTNFIKYIFSAIIMGLVIYLSKSLGFVISAFLGTITYVVFLFLTKAIDIAIINQIINLNKNENSN
ncbi:MAG: flippase [Patescibacteria group bacterium]|jgi:O-antigen/teichoic acid export membrane protein